MKHRVGYSDSNSVVRGTEDTENQIPQTVPIFCGLPKLVHNPHLLIARRSIFRFSDALAGLIDAVVDVVQHCFAPGSIFFSALGNGDHDISLCGHECIHEAFAGIWRSESIHRSTKNEFAGYVKRLFTS
jgi:hypothetical protein